MLAIIAISAAITAPTFVKSMRGNRRREAARVLVMAGRYARSMAVLRQEDHAITFNIETATLTVHRSAAPPKPEQEEGKEGDMMEVLESSGLAKEREDETPAVTNVVAFKGETELKRVLDRVRIDFIRIGDEAEITEGIATVVYRTNGRCDPYSVRIVDEGGVPVIVNVDALSFVETETE